MGKYSVFYRILPIFMTRINLSRHETTRRFDFPAGRVWRGSRGPAGRLQDREKHRLPRRRGRPEHRHDVPAGPLLSGGRGGIHDRHMVPRRRPDGRAARNSRSVEGEGIRRGGRGVPALAAREGGRLRGRCGRVGGVGGEAYRRVRRRSAADFRGGPLGGRLSDLGWTSAGSNPTASTPTRPSRR